jgi:NADH-quinone oxidoreductase subunit A
MKSLFFYEYTTFLVLFMISFLLACIIFGASYSIAYQRPDTEKLSMYECGFDAYEDGRNRFDVKFYIVALLFIIFDLETVFLFPFSVNLGQLNTISFFSMSEFFSELLVGFYYVWVLGVLEW